MLGRPLTVLDLLTADYWNVKNASNRIIFRNDGTGEVRTSSSHEQILFL